MANTVIQLKYSNVTGTPPLLNIAEPAYSNVSNKLWINDGTDVIAIGGKFYTDTIDAATSSDVANTLVRRDTSGNFSSNTITANTVIVDGYDIYEFANSAFSAANNAFIAGGTIAGSYANSAYLHANSAYISQNTTGQYANSAYLHANSAYISQNTTGVYANSAYAEANTANQRAVTSGDYANSAYAHANTRFASAGGTISGDVSITGNLVISGETTYANTTTVNLGDNIITLNADIPQDLAPSEDSGIEVDRGSSANVSLIWNESTDKWTFTNDGSTYSDIGSAAAESYANSAYAQANTANDNAISAGSYANSAFNTANTSSINATSAGSYANSAYAQANTAQAQADAGYNQANTATTNAATADQRAVTSGDYANSAFTQANTATTNAATAQTHANEAYNQANTAQAQANAGYNQANTATVNAATADQKAVTSGSYANSAYTQANTATTNASTAQTHANEAYNQANTGTQYATSAGVYANSAYAEANTKLSSSGGTISGNLSVTGDLFVSGNTVTIDTETINVQDSLIKLANNNTSDVLDIGFYGQYDASGVLPPGSVMGFTGLIRDASDGIFKLFTGETTDPTSNVVSYGAENRATLDANFTGGNVSGLFNAISVSDGGLGVKSLSANSVILGNGTDPVLTVGSSTEGHILTISASGAPTFQHLNGGSF
jgi:hypothetical protein